MGEVVVNIMHRIRKDLPALILATMAFIVIAVVAHNPWYLLGLAWVGLLSAMDIYMTAHPRVRSRQR
jgi:hypothetical protein